MAQERVSLRDIYDAVNNLETKLDRRLERDETRLDNLENGFNKTLGVVSVITVFITTAMSFLWDRLLQKK